MASSSRPDDGKRDQKRKQLSKRKPEEKNITSKKKGELAQAFTKAEEKTAKKGKGFAPSLMKPSFLHVERPEWNIRSTESKIRC